MSTISPSLQIGGVNGWKSKEGAVLGWQQTIGNLFKPAKFDFTRLSGSASYVDENGLIQIEHRPNYPRFTWQDGKQCLMNEEARTNLNSRSEDFTTTWATAASATVTGNTTAAPDGATTADTISLAAVADSRVTQTFTLANSTTYTLSCFFKNDSLTAGQTFDFRLVNNTVAPNNFQMIATVDLAAGSVVISEAGTAGTGISGTATGGIENYGNGWYRVFVTATTGSGAGTASATVEIISSNARQFFAWGAQLEVGSYVSSYIPTSGSAVTRAAESIEGLNLGNFLGDSEGGLYADFVYSQNVINTPWLRIANAAGTKYIEVVSLSDYTIRVRYYNGSTFFTNISTSTVLSEGDHKLFFSYSGSTLTFYLDGVLIGSGDMGETPSGIEELLISDPNVSSKNAFFYEIKAYDQAPDNTQMQTQTS